jgi:hypothetical protein
MKNNKKENKYAFAMSENGEIEYVVIYLTQGQKTLIDYQDWLNPKVQYIKWNAMWTPIGRTFYVQGRNYKKMTTLHLFIMGKQNNLEIDHKNGDSLDNRRNNLRFVTASENCCNKKRMITNISGYKGVRFHKEAQKWESRITKNYKTYNLGLYNTKEEAYKIYCEKAKELHGDFARFK